MPVRSVFLVAAMFGLSCATALAQPGPPIPPPNTVGPSPAPVFGDVQPTGNLPEDTDARLRALEQIVTQQQTQVESLTEQLKAATAPPPEDKPYRIGSDLRMSGTWNNGLEFRSKANDFYFHVGGRTQFDNVALSSPNPTAALTNVGTTNDGLQDSAFFRRARLRMEGTIWDQFDWCVEYNFVNSFLAQNPTRGQDIPAGTGWTGSTQSSTNLVSTIQNDMFNPVSPVDLWWNIRDVPLVGNVQFGNEKEPFALERLESSRYLDFLERNYGNDAFISPSANGFAPGIMIWNYTRNRRATYAVGVFKNVTNPFVFNIGDGQNEVAGRVTYLPWYDQATGGRYFMHFGMGACSRAVDNNFINYRTRGDLRNGPDAVIPSWTNTGYFFGDAQNILNPEFMLQYGSLFIQSEYVANWTTNAFTNVGNNPGLPQGTVFFQSYYIQAMYFLTGEHRIYDYQKGVVGRVLPYENVFAYRRRSGARIFGRGAVQVGSRLNWIDLNNKAIRGGRLLGNTYALNWFWNPNMKLQLNFDVMHRWAADGQAAAPAAGFDQYGIIYGFGTRFAADF
ncbi:MAG TPA: porin [Pirellulales bacterium]|nr:porin [Pirellulales bacterium]